jgi:hypothetical protein
VPDAIEEYLAELSLTKTLRDRIATILEWYRALLPEPVARVFVSETVDQEGQHLFESAWVFTESFVCEADDFLHSNSFDAASTSLGITHWRFKFEEYEPGEATSTSRANLSFEFTSGISARLKASGANCEHLYALMKEFVLPRAISPSRDVVSRSSGIGDFLQDLESPDLDG